MLQLADPRSDARKPARAGPPTRRAPSAAATRLAAGGRIQRLLAYHGGMPREGGAVSPGVAGEIAAASGGGRPLEEGTRAEMEGALGGDFGGVRVHADARADRLALALSARAFTLGSHVFFRAGAYDPASRGGRGLLAHELTHTAQQRGGAPGVQARLEVGPADDAFEREADAAARGVAEAPAGGVRRCACGGIIGADGECDQCRARRQAAGAASPRIQRVPDEAPSGGAAPVEPCAGYGPGELSASRTGAGLLADDVEELGSGKLLVADFGVDWRHVKAQAGGHPLLSSWLSRFEADDSYRLVIAGYTDCVGGERSNTRLRAGRASRVEDLLGPAARTRVRASGAAPAGDYVTSNASAAGRARNRGVVITFHRELDFSEDEVDVIEVERRACGPGVAQWLVDQMNANKDHPTIVTMREVTWPRYIPGVNIGWTAAALYDFASLVAPGAVWDFKAHARRFGWRSAAGRSCPTSNCDRTVTMCGLCFNYDVPGNIHFGWVGAASGLRSWLLHFGAGIVQTGRWTDDPRDAAAVEIGEEMWNSGTDLCSQLRSRRSELNLDRTENCSSCPS